MVQHWICDTCGEPILKPMDGRIEWVNVYASPFQRSVRDMRLVHGFTASPLYPKGACQFDASREFRRDKGTISNRPLKAYLGPNGLMNLLEHLADPAFSSIDIVEMIRRIQIPGYDCARLQPGGMAMDRVIPAKRGDLLQLFEVIDQLSGRVGDAAGPSSPRGMMHMSPPYLAHGRAGLSVGS